VQGTPRGVGASGVDWRLVITAALMTLSSAVGLAGATTIGRSTLGRANN